MADTQTTNIQLTNQTEGGNDNTWGTKADDNFERIDDVLGDTTDITTSGGTTTLTDEQELVAALQIGGTLASNASIVFSGRGGFWIVENNTTGNFSVTCLVSGQTGVEIAQGTAALIWCDGTDIRAGTPTSEVLADTSPQLGGDLDANGFNIGFDDATGITDDSGNEQLIFQKTASAVNHLEVTNAAMGNSPSLAAAGDDTNIDLTLAGKGTGGVNITGALTALGGIELGHASDTTLARSGAGDMTIEGKAVYRADGTDVPVADGGTGRSSATAYAVLCGGTTPTGAHQSIAGVGTSGEVLTSNGAGALPTFQAVGSPVDYQVFTANGTWNKPSKGVIARIQAWGGGGGGGTGQSGDPGGGGGGGAYNEAWIPMSSLGSSETVTIGAGGGPSIAGGTTSFGSHLSAFGGGAGYGDTSNSGGAGGGGGGQLEAGEDGSSGTGGDGGGPGGGTGGAADTFPTDGLGGGGGGGAASLNAGPAGGRSFWGGGGGGGENSNGHGGDSTWGGGGGGASGSNGGLSLHGGDGGDGSDGGNGGDGTAPGGGGGGSNQGGTAGSGARGEVRVTVF